MEEYYDVVSVAADAKPGMPGVNALLAALVAVETYKLGALKARDAAKPAPTPAPAPAFRNTYASVGANVHVSAVATALPCTTVATKTGTFRWSVWDVIDLGECGVAKGAGDALTLKRVIDAFKEKFGLEVGAVSIGPSLLYADFMNPAKTKDKLERPLVDVLTEIGKMPPVAEMLTCARRLRELELNHLAVQSLSAALVTDPMSVCRVTLAGLPMRRTGYQTPS